MHYLFLRHMFAECYAYLHSRRVSTAATLPLDDIKGPLQRQLLLLLALNMPRGKLRESSLSAELAKCATLNCAHYRMLCWHNTDCLPEAASLARPR